MPLNPDSELARLMAILPQVGQVEWIGLRPARDVAMTEVEQAEAITEHGLRGDRYTGGSGKRSITLIQAEHLPAIAALAGVELVPALLLKYGAFLQTAIDFLIIAFVIFLFLKAYNRVRAPAPVAATPEDIVLLREIRDSLKK